MIIMMQKMHLDKIHFLKSRISQLELKKLRSQNIKTLTYQDCNIIKK